MITTPESTRLTWSDENFAADLHIHSRYSRATSRDMTPETIARAAAAKGLSLVGTGDFTHPEWLEELKEALEPAEPGLYMLRNRQDLPRFMLTAEISNIFTQGGRGRRIHTVVMVPDFEVAEEIQGRLDELGNIHSDGRPIFGFPVKRLVRIVMEASPDCFVVPAHVWTPWFALFGAKSGFDSIEECFEEETVHIHALETGLSSDPQMNWRISALDSYTLVSNSDAHSPAKLAREANIFSCDMNYYTICSAIRGEQEGFDGTVEFFPEEGKYHYDGHRACGVCLKPLETLENKGLCPVCGKPLTVGVMHRVEEFADRPEGFVPPLAKPCIHVIPLEEIVREVYGIKTVTKRVRKTCDSLVSLFGSELSMLLSVPEEELKDGLSEEMFIAVMAARKGEIDISPGHDGEYGKVSIRMDNNACPNPDTDDPAAQKGRQEPVQHALF